jgi:histidine ammonia-lyase
LRQGKGVHLRAQELHAFVRKQIAKIEEDRRMDGDIAQVLESLRENQWPLG